MSRPSMEDMVAQFKQGAEYKEFTCMTCGKPSKRAVFTKQESTVMTCRVCADTQPKRVKAQREARRNFKEELVSSKGKARGE